MREVVHEHDAVVEAIMAREQLCEFDRAARLDCVDARGAGLARQECKNSRAAPEVDDDVAGLDVSWIARR